MPDRPPCTECGASRDIRNAPNGLCHKCYERIRQAKKRAENLVLNERLCESCDKTFVTTNTNKRFCSEECRKRSHYLANQERYLAAQAADRKANPEKKQASNARYRKRNRETIRVNEAAFYAENRERINAGVRAKRAANPEPFRAYKRTAKERDPEKVREQQAASRERRRASLAAKGQVYAAKPETRERRRQRDRENPEPIREANHRRRSRINGARVSHRAVYERDGGKCHLCGLAVPFDVMSLDHLVPLARGGIHTFENVRCSHRTCNMRRKASGPAQLLLL